MCHNMGKPGEHDAKWKKLHVRDFPGGPMAKTLRSQCVGGSGSDPGQGTRFRMPQLKIPYAAPKTWCSQVNLKKKPHSKGQLLYDHTSVNIE